MVSSVQYAENQLEHFEDSGESIDYLAVFKRRKKVFWVTALAILIATVLVALLLPPVYKSSSTILIEKQEISPELIQTSVASYAEQQIQEVTQRVMTRTNLWRVIDKFNLYPDDRKRETRDTIIEKMRDDIDIEFINAELSSPAQGGRPAQVMIAFTLSYEYPDPAIAQKVASELTSLFLEENLRARTETASEAVQFLTEEARRLKEQVDEIQNRLASFKEKNLDRLPELNELYRSELEQIDRQRMDLSSQERALKDRLFYLQGQLAQIDPHAMAVTSEGVRVLGVHDRLKTLRAEYPTLLARYSPNHPDVLRIKKEIEALEKEANVPPDLQALNAELRQKEAELVTLRKKYSERHPSVTKLQREIDNLRKEIKSASPKSSYSSNTSNLKPDNPAYITLQAQLESTRSDLNAIRGIKEELDRREKKIRSHLAGMPLVEKDYQDLLEELDTTIQRYRDIRARELHAKVSQQFEVERKGERLTLIDPPQIPEEADSPKRGLIVLLGLILGVGGGAALAALTEALDNTIHDENMVMALVGVPPLATIPYLNDPDESERRETNKYWLIIGGLLVLLLVLMIFHFAVVPLDVLWFKALRVLGINGVD